jgi:hypothetical protein
LYVYVKMYTEQHPRPTHIISRISGYSGYSGYPFPNPDEVCQRSKMPFQSLMCWPCTTEWRR